MSLPNLRPAKKDGSPSQPMRKLLLGREVNNLLCPLLGKLLLPTEVVELGRPRQGHGEVVWMRQLVGQCERPVAHLRGLIRMTKHPQNNCIVR